MKVKYNRYFGGFIYKTYKEANKKFLTSSLVDGYAKAEPVKITSGKYNECWVARAIKGL